MVELNSSQLITLKFTTGLLYMLRIVQTFAQLFYCSLVFNKMSKLNCVS